MRSIVVAALVWILIFAYSAHSEESDFDFSDRELDLTGIKDMPNGYEFDFFNGVAHGINPNIHEDMKKCIRDISEDQWNRIVYTKNKFNSKNGKQTVKYWFIFEEVYSWLFYFQSHQ